MIGTDIVYLPRISPDSPFCDYVLSSEEKKDVADAAEDAVEDLKE